MSEKTHADEHELLYDDPKLTEAARAFERGDHAQSRRLLGEVGEVAQEDAMASERLRRALTFDRMSLVVAGGMLLLWVSLALITL